MSILVVMWHRKPTRAWNIVMAVLVTLVVLMSVAGAVMPRPEYLQ